MKRCLGKRRVFLEFVKGSVGQLAITSPVDRVGLVIFASMGLLMGMVTELHRRYLHLEGSRA